MPADILRPLPNAEAANRVSLTAETYSTSQNLTFSNIDSSNHFFTGRNSRMGSRSVTTTTIEEEGT
jgi:hypothetical protein